MALNMFVALGVNVTVFSAHYKKVNKWKRVRAEGGKKKKKLSGKRSRRDEF